MQKSINHNLFFPHAPQDVWEYLTSAELMAQWLMKNDFKPVVGHQFNFLTGPLPQFDFDGIAYCTVLEVVPFEKLVYSWKSGPGNGVITLDSLVTWTLHKKDNGTELQLDHTGFKELENVAMYTAMNNGWISNMHKIADYLKKQKNGTTNA